jgi:hypothetical protein
MARTALICYQFACSQRLLVGIQFGIVVGLTSSRS